MVTFVHPQSHRSFLPASPKSFFLSLLRTPRGQASHTWVCGHLWGHEHPPGTTLSVATVVSILQISHPTPPLRTPEASTVNSCSVKGRSTEAPPPSLWNVDELIYSDKCGCWGLTHTVPIPHRSDALLYCLHCISIHKTNFTKSIIRKRNKELILST